MPEHLSTLFVFGTLRCGEQNHHLLQSRFLRWLPAVLRGFRRETGAHGYPVVVPSPAESVTGELYFLAPTETFDTLSQCDRLEGLLQGQLIGPDYQRAQVIVETTEGPIIAWAYLPPSH